MRFIFTLTLVLTALLMTGCNLHQVKGEVGGVEVEAQTKDYKDSGDEGFCPPGQAKKGKC